MNISMFYKLKLPMQMQDFVIIISSLIWSLSLITFYHTLQTRIHKPWMVCKYFLGGKCLKKIKGIDVQIFDFVIHLFSKLICLTKHLSYLLLCSCLFSHSSLDILFRILWFSFLRGKKISMASINGTIWNINVVLGNWLLLGNGCMCK